MSARIPHVSKLHLSFVGKINQVATWEALFTGAARPPSQMFQFFKEFKMHDVAIAVRRRRPLASVFQSASGGNTVSAARAETNDIYWVPYSSNDVPVQHPRQIRGAILVRDQWTIKRIRQTCIKTEIVNRPYGTNGPGRNQLISSTNWTLPSNNIPGYFVQTRRPMPWIQNDYEDAGPPGTLNQTLTGLNPAPGATTNSATFSPTGVFGGFFFVDNQSAMLNDELEIRMMVRYLHRGRKPIGRIIDESGDLNIQDITQIQLNQDAPGKPSGFSLNSSDYLDIHTAGYGGPPDPGDECFPCGPTPAYLVEP